MLKFNEFFKEKTGYAPQDMYWRWQPYDTLFEILMETIPEYIDYVIQEKLQPRNGE